MSDSTESDSQDEQSSELYESSDSSLRIRNSSNEETDSFIWQWERWKFN